VKVVCRFRPINEREVKEAGTGGIKISPKFEDKKTVSMPPTG